MASTLWLNCCKAGSQGRDGADPPLGQKPVPQAVGDPVLVDLPGRSLDVQARGRGAIWRWNPSR